MIRLGAKKISNLFSKATTDFIRNQDFRRRHEMLLFGNKQFLKIFRMILTMCLLVLICKFKPNNLITGGCFYLLVEQARQFLLTYLLFPSFHERLQHCKMHFMFEIRNRVC